MVLQRWLIQQNRSRRHGPPDPLLVTHLSIQSQVVLLARKKARVAISLGAACMSQFSFSYLATATNNFSMDNKLRRGGFGSILCIGEYFMHDGTGIAAKRPSKFSGQAVEEFKNEVHPIAQLQNRNLVRILGSCCVEDEKNL